MRPRVFPAEDVEDRETCVKKASRRFNEAAGIPRGRHWLIDGVVLIKRSFNEAAGIPRGRRQIGKVTFGFRELASMRPRVFPAEDGGGLDS